MSIKSSKSDLGSLLSVISGRSTRVVSFQTMKTKQEFRELRRLIKDQKANSMRQTIKMMTVILLPLIALICVSIVSLIQSAATYLKTFSLETSMMNSFSLSTLVSSLQVERGLTAMHLTVLEAIYKQQNQQQNQQENQLLLNSTASFIATAAPIVDFVLQNVSMARKNVNTSFYTVIPWLPVLIGDSIIKSEDDLSSYLNSFRQYVDSGIMGVSAVKTEVSFYTNLTLSLISVMVQNVDVPTYEALWRNFVAFESLLSAGDAAGLIRAIGTTFFVQCFMDSDMYSFFANVVATTQANLDHAFLFNPDLNLQYNSLVTAAAQMPTETAINQWIATINNIALHNSSSCLSSDISDRMKIGLQWFANMTTHMSIISMLRIAVVNVMLAKLANGKKESKDSLIIYSVIMVVFSIFCILLSSCYARALQKMTTKIAKYAKEMSAKTNDLANEKRR